MHTFFQASVTLIGESANHASETDDAAKAIPLPLPRAAKALRKTNDLAIDTGRYGTNPRAVLDGSAQGRIYTTFNMANWKIEARGTGEPSYNTISEPRAITTTVANSGISTATMKMSR